VEFKNAAEINRIYPQGVRLLADGGVWDLLAGQPTDDSEMALVLARSIVERGEYSSEAAFAAYRFWHDSSPFDIGRTILSARRGRLNHDSQANGALMRISPLGIFGANKPLESLKTWAMADAALTHPNKLCQEANALYVLAISLAIREGPEPVYVYRSVLAWAEEFKVDHALLQVVREAADGPPADFSRQKGWALIAFRNALYQLLRAPSLEEGLVDTVGRGGDTDTNAAICGALLGATYGLEALPSQWVETILSCLPQAGRAGVRHPRPECFWPTDALELAARLLGESPA
jgi:ADP-ribosylglycohydrolase